MNMPCTSRCRAPARRLGALCVLLVPLLAIAAESDRRFDFEVLLDGKAIGTHRFDITARADASTRVQSTASFDVRFLGIPVYRYRHQASERWQGGCLQQIDATTHDNGALQRVQGAMSGGGFALQHPAARPLGGACVNAYAYWDPARLLPQTQLLNPQTGQIDRVRIERVGEEVVSVRNESMLADRYRLSGEKLQVELWYSRSGDWLQLESRVGPNRVLRYRLRN
jgi:hypothetical protein